MESSLPEQIKMNGIYSGLDQTTCKRFFTGLILTLSHKNGVILQVDSWYLILSSMLRGEIPKSIREILDDCMLTARINVNGEDYVFECLQPDEFKGDGREVTKSVTP
jgi:hypothetical protein